MGLLEQLLLESHPRLAGILYHHPHHDVITNPGIAGADHLGPQLLTGDPQL